MLAGVPRLVAQVAVAALRLRIGERLAVGDETAHGDDLPFGFDPLVVVDPELRSADAVAGRHHLAGRLAGGGERSGAEGVIRHRRAVEGHAGAGLHLDPDGNLEALEVAPRVPGRLDPQGAEAVGEPGLGRVEAGGADPPALAGVVGQPAHVVAEAVRRRGLRRRGRRRTVGILHPAGHEDVGLPRLRAVAVGGEGEVGAVGGDQGKAVEAGGPGDPLEAAAVEVDRPDVELPPLGVAVVRGEQDALAGGEERRAERGGVQIGDLAGLAAVGVGGPDLELGGAHQPLGEQAAVVVELGLVLRPRGAPDDLRAVGGEEGAAVVAGGVGQPPHVPAVGVHAVEVEVAVARRGEDQRAVLGADGGLGVVGVVVGQADGVRAVGLDAQDLVVGVDLPDVAVRAVGGRRAGGIVEVGRRVEDAAGVGRVVGAGGPPLAGRHQGQRPRAVGGGAEDLVAAVGGMGRLEDQPRAVRRPVGLGVLAAAGDLAQVREVDLARVEGRHFLRRREARQQVRGEEKRKENRQSPWSHRVPRRRIGLERWLTPAILHQTEGARARPPQPRTKEFQTTPIG